MPSGSRSSSATARSRPSAIATEQKEVAQTQRDRAERNFGIAKNAADHVVFRIAQDLRNVQGMRVESVRRILDAAQAMMDELARAAPDDLQLQRSRAAMLAGFATPIWRRRSDARAGRGRGKPRDHAQARRRRSGQCRLAARREREPRKVGDVRLAAGDRAGALAAYEESLAIMRKLAAADPGNAGWQRDVSVSLNKVGDVRLAAGDRRGRLRPTRRASRSGASSPPPIQAMPNGSAT